MTEVEFMTLDFLPDMSGLPTESQVQRWLTQYQHWCQVHQPERPGFKRFRPSDWSPLYDEEPELLPNRGGDAATQWWLDQHAIFEQRYAAYERFRQTMGRAHTEGFMTAVEGQPRTALAYQGKRHEVFAWLNGWAVGEYDYLWKRGLVMNLRSPGVKRKPVLANPQPS